MGSARSKTFPRVDLPHDGERVLCLAPPGELAGFAASCLDRVGDGRVCALVPGDAYVHAELPVRLEVFDGDPAAPHAIRGPFDAVLIWSSTPFLRGFDCLLAPIHDALRPGGRIALDVPAYGFCAMLQAADPRAAAWFLPNRAATRDALETLGFRDAIARTWTAVVDYDTLGDLLDDLAKPFPLAFEGAAGAALQSDLAEQLARGFEGVDELSLALRRVTATARR